MFNQYRRKHYDINLKEHTKVVSASVLDSDASGYPRYNQEESLERIRFSLARKIADILLKSNLIEIVQTSRDNNTVEYNARLYIVDSENLYARIFPQDCI